MYQLCWVGLSKVSCNKNGPNASGHFCNTFAIYAAQLVKNPKFLGQTLHVGPVRRQGRLKQLPAPREQVFPCLGRHELPPTAQ